MGDQAMESLGTEARGGQDSDSKRKRELLLLRREGGSCFCYEEKAGVASATKGGGSCFCFARG